MYKPSEVQQIGMNPKLNEHDERSFHVFPGVRTISGLASKSFRQEQFTGVRHISDGGAPPQGIAYRLKIDMIEGYPQIMRADDCNVVCTILRAG
ncbi:hypothetical protein SUGI_0040850 [Cryptomeria japonica]|nr:hypothetical protein SUGI_0040850 [Cryptomeria japonica]